MSQIVRPANQSTLVLNGYSLSDFVTGDQITLTYANPKTARQNAANNGVNIIEREDAFVADMEINLQLGSPDDSQMTSWLNSGIVVLEGTWRTQFLRDGNPIPEVYSLRSGSITSPGPRTRNSEDGNNQMAYTIQFRAAKRII